MADQLCTTAQVKARLFPNGTTDVTDDTLISELIDQVTSWIQGFTGRKLVPVASTSYLFDTVAGYVLRVPLGIQAVTFLEVAASSQPDNHASGTFTTVPAADYLLRPKTQDLPDGWPYTEIHISRGPRSGSVSRFVTAQNGAYVTATYGFAATPPDIQAVAIDATVAAFQARRNGASSVMGAEDVAMPPWAKFFGQGSPQRGTLLRYRYQALG